MDDIDRQIERDEFLLNAHIAVRKPFQKATGFCFNCDEPIPQNSCYCDADCREDHEKEQRLRQLCPEIT